MHLIEANAKKAAFLREAARVTETEVTIHNKRIEDAIGDLPDKVDAVLARALAPLPKLLDLADPLLKKGATGYFHKGTRHRVRIDRSHKILENRRGNPPDGR